MSLPAEVRKKVKLLELRTRKLVNSSFVGQYHSAFKGQGMTFAEFREYVPGDDVRNISWSLTARTGKTFIKKFDEERELTLIFAVDVSASVEYGSQSFFKGEVMTHLAALLSYGALQNNDHVGLLLFSDQIEFFVPPKKGRAHIQRILRDLYFVKPQNKKTKIASAAEYLQGILKKKSLIFVISDFMDQNYSTSLKSLSRKHEVVACVVQDPIEKKIPDLGLIEVYDPELEEFDVIDTSSKAFQAEYTEIYKQFEKRRELELRQSKVDQVIIPVNEDFSQPIIRYFQMKSSRR